MRILVYGGRDYGLVTFDIVGGTETIIDGLTVISMIHILTSLGYNPKKDTVITGGANGADTIAHLIAKAMGGNTEVYEAEWHKYGKSAGFRRNKQMRDSGVDKGIAFPGGKGTANMTKLLKEAGVKVIEVSVSN